jgi:hypothetical protein
LLMRGRAGVMVKAQAATQILSANP